MNKTALTANASVHASAGSGKTYLLVSKVIHLLLSGHKPATILAITFTRKAAAEMHTRLMERLYTLSCATDEVLEEELRALEIKVSKNSLDNARHLYERLLHDASSIKITTFHAFCQELLRRFPIEANIAPGFELQDKTSTLRQTAWHALMNQAAQQTGSQLADSFSTLLSFFSPPAVHDLLDRFLAARSDWWAFTYHSDDPVDEALQQLADRLKLPDGQNDTDSTGLFFNKHESSLRRQVQLLAMHPTKTHASMIEAIDASLESIEPGKKLSLLTEALFTKSYSPRSMKTSKTLADKLGAEGAEELVNMHYQLCDALSDLHKNLARQQVMQINRAWLSVGNSYLEHYQKIKAEQRILDFTDLEWKTYTLLNHANNAVWVQYKLDERIDHLLVDEFQDTNPTQWHLLLPVLKELASNASDRMRSVFLVGDAKQSIYRFRRANAELFNQASNWLEQHLQAERFPLNKSYRSSPAIMQFVNSLFSEKDPGRFDFETHDTHLDDVYGKVTLLPLCKPEEENITTQADKQQLRNPLLAARPEKENKTYLEEGYLVASTISELLENGTLVNENGINRPVQYKDIMVLLRNRTHIQYYEQAFRESKIPYLGADRGTLLESLEVNDMLNLLHWLITPYDNLALAGILRCPLFNASDDDLLQLATHPEHDWLNALGKLVEEAKVTGPLVRAHQLLHRWLSHSGQVPVHDLLDRIYSEANVVERYRSAFPDHLASRIQSNLTRFIELALEMDSGRYPSLTRFTAWIEELKQQQDDAPDSPSESGSDNRVSFMTIHSAKGLEAPVVFLADSAQPGKEVSNNSVIVDWPADSEKPLSFFLAHKTDFIPDYIEACLQAENRQIENEDTNLLYVALTRARQYLFISASQTRNTRSMGWYGEICVQYDLVSNDVDEARVLCEAGQLTQPLKAVTADTVIDFKTEKIPQSFTLQNRFKEIAPSKVSASQYQGSGQGDEDSQQRGIIIHKMLEILADNPATRFDEITSAIRLPATETELRDYWQEAMAVISDEQLASLFTTSDTAQARNEVSILFKQDQNTVHGIIDRLIIDNDCATIVDYKTHNNIDEPMMQALAVHYQPQMALYAEGVRKIHPHYKVKAYLLFTSTRKLVAVDV